MENCPMSNHPCDKPKTIQYCLIDGNDTCVFNICQNCPSLHGMNDEVFSSCLACGSTRMDIEKTGKMGCAECYKRFAGLAELLFVKCQHASSHVGKRPRCLTLMSESQLRELLRRSVESEDYETAEDCKRMLAKTPTPEGRQDL